jgi:DNA-binding NarL/FixJ family response regulator
MVSQRIRVLMVDDHPLLSEGLAAVIQNQPDMIPVCQASSGREAVQLFEQYKPDITLMDLRLPDMSGIDAVVTIRSRFPEARFIILTTFAGDAEIQRALEAGARAYLLKTVSPQETMHVIRQVHAGKRRISSEVAAHLAEHYNDERLTGREVDILRQLAGGEPQSGHRRQVVYLGRNR